jgi:hypothetical protein
MANEKDKWTIQYFGDRSLSDRDLKKYSKLVPVKDLLILKDIIRTLNPGQTLADKELKLCVTRMNVHTDYYMWLYYHNGSKWIELAMIYQWKYHFEGGQRLYFQWQKSVSLEQSLAILPILQQFVANHKHLTIPPVVNSENSVTNWINQVQNIVVTTKDLIAKWQALI